MEQFQELLQRVRQSLGIVKYKVLVLSGKGGVGKTFISVNLALLLAERGLRTGIFDADLHGPSVPKVLGLRGQRLRTSDHHIEPVRGPLGIEVVSMDFLLPEDRAALIWRGPLKSRAILELLAYTRWSNLDYLIVDLPPGTGDEALTVAQLIPDPRYVILVTQPTELSHLVVGRALTFAEKLGLRILGLVVNMAYLRCPQCGAVIRLFPGLPTDLGIKVITEVPFSTEIPRLCDHGITSPQQLPEEVRSALEKLADYIVEQTGVSK